MGAELGRISGPLLASNLLRGGVDLAFETDLLYIDAVNGRIGINTTSPSQDLSISSTTSVADLIVDTSADLVNNTFVSNRIQNVLNSIYISPNQLLDPQVITKEIQTLSLKLTDNYINNITNNSDIVFTTQGTGKVKFNTGNVEVFGDLHATGNITFTGGQIIIGTGPDDSVIFEADLTSSLIPDEDNTYTLGSSSAEWSKLYTVNTDLDTITVPSLVINNIDLLLPQGNTIYVAVNGTDTNTGVHQHAPVRTIKHALSLATAGIEIVVYPGIYQEEFPLIIPQGVSVRGAGIRSVAIEPTPETNNKDCFLLNGETTVSFLTVQNFFYDSVNNTGYAFRFAPGIKVTSRSPYMFNVSVITRGSVITPTDPLGFDQGDAGGGAYLDGSVADPSSNEATGLFFSATFIVPNQNGIWANNGTRVEWLNSFTYFAKRGIYLTRGDLGFASLGTKYGSEMRSINSANVYGTYGAVADGLDTLGYLIGHNFGYIGTGSDSQNDRSLVVQANEIVPINGGILYFDSMDHKGDYRIGDIFYVNQETGAVTFNAQSIDFGVSGSIVLESPSGLTIINKSQIQTGNLKIYGNTIESLAGPVNFSAASTSTYLNDNVYVTGSLDVIESAVMYSDVYFGNESTDLIDINSYITQDFLPRVTNTFDLGVSGLTPNVWNTLFVSKLDVDAVAQIDSNTISTVTTNTDLILDAIGTGKLTVSSTNVQIDQNLTVVGTTTVNGLTTLQSTETTGTTTLVGNYQQVTGNTYITGTFANGNINITGPSYLELPQTTLFNNVISINDLNTNLIFTANGTGGVVLDQKLKITDSTINNIWAGATTDVQKSIYFTPNGTGNVVINSTQSLRVPYTNNTNEVLTTPGQIRQNSTTTWYEGYHPTGNVSFNNLYDVDKNTYIIAQPTPLTNDNILRFGINGVQRATISTVSLATPLVYVDNISISSSTFSNLNTAIDLEIAPATTDMASINGISFQENTITNQLDTALTLASNGPDGWIKFGGKAIVLPIGATVDRRSTPELGEMRFNTTLNYMEIFNGVSWIPVIGELSAISASEVDNIMDTFALIFG